MTFSHRCIGAKRCPGEVRWADVNEEAVFPAQRVPIMPHVPSLSKFLTGITHILPLWPLELALSRLAKDIVHRHPGLLERLAPNAGSTIAVVPADIDAVFLITLGSGAPTVKVVRGVSLAHVDARIEGALLALVDLAEGRLDGDALFFSREIVIEGDMEVVVALRNALDAEGLDLVEEACHLFGPLAGSMNRAGRGALNLLRDGFAGSWSGRIAS